MIQTGSWQKKRAAQQVTLRLGQAHIAEPEMEVVAATISTKFEIRSS